MPNNTHTHTHIQRTIIVASTECLTWLDVHCTYDRYVHKHMYTICMKNKNKIHAVRMLQYCFLFDAIIFFLCFDSVLDWRVHSLLHITVEFSARKKKKLERWSINLHCALRLFSSAKFLIIFIKQTYTHREREGEIDSMPFKYHCMMQHRQA